MKNESRGRIGWCFSALLPRPKFNAACSSLSKADVLYKRAEAETSAATKSTPWQQYAQALLSSGEFYYIN